MTWHLGRIKKILMLVLKDGKVMSSDVENGSYFQSCINEPFSLNFFRPTIDDVQFQPVLQLLENGVKAVKI